MLLLIMGQLVVTLYCLGYKYVVFGVEYKIMFASLKKCWPVILTILVTLGMLIYLYGCEPKTQSLVSPARQINRQELQLELDQIIGLAQLRMVDLDKQEQLRAVILQNALILVQGQPFNPLGLITAVAAVYGVTQGGRNVTKVVKTVKQKRRENNGTT
ncbi:unnamed protein product [marine sediment metagenome]|uniref:Uncharacterized protein n=1 Tax=marine sediment metagenome TaxID=412755 RepID=X1QYQ5_9ZZZZ